MIREGDDAPGFELPAVVDGERRTVALSEFLGTDVVILAFYPADFNPACDAESDLDELDLFTMQKDVAVLGIGPDTVYSHEAFADEYNLAIPLLADTRRAVAEDYGVAFEDELGQSMIERAVFVIDHDGTVCYRWSTREMDDLPDVDAVKDAIAETGGDDTAFARYRVGYAHYVEARRAFTSAMGAYSDSEWMMAQSDFARARDEFDEAADHFDSAIRFVDDPDHEPYYERSKEKASSLWQAADWLAESASAYSSGSGAEGQQLQDDAERPLENARDLGEPVDPDDWPPDPDAEDEGSETLLPSEDEESAELAVDIDEAVEEGADDEATDDDNGQELAEADDGATPDQATADGSTADEGGGEGDDTDDESDIDEAELREIEAELAAESDEPVESPPEERTSMVDAPPGLGDDAEAEQPGDAEGAVDEGDEEEPDDESRQDGEVSDADEVDEADLAELEAEIAASDPGDQAIDQDPSSGDGGGTDLDDAPPDLNADDAPPDLNDDGAVADDSPAGGDANDDEDERDVPPPGSGSLEVGGAGNGGSGASLEPSGTGDPAATDGQSTVEDPSDDRERDGNDDEEEEALGEPTGATDEDMASIPTTDDLAEGEGERKGEGEGEGGAADDQRDEGDRRDEGDDGD